MILPHAPHRLAGTRAVDSLPKPGRFAAWPERGWPFGPAIVADWRCRPGSAVPANELGRARDIPSGTYVLVAHAHVLALAGILIRG